LKFLPLLVTHTLYLCLLLSPVNALRTLITDPPKSGATVFALTSQVAQLWKQQHLDRADRVYEPEVSAIILFPSFFSCSGFVC
jgi:hypothetical protein